MFTPPLINVKYSNPQTLIAASRVIFLYCLVVPYRVWPLGQKVICLLDEIFQSFSSMEIRFLHLNLYVNFMNNLIHFIFYRKWLFQVFFSGILQIIWEECPRNFIQFSMVLGLQSAFQLGNFSSTSGLIWTEIYQQFQGFLQINIKSLIHFKMNYF